MNLLQHTYKATDTENDEENLSPNTDAGMLDSLASIGDDLEEEEDESQLSLSRVSFLNTQQDDQQPVEIFLTLYLTSWLLGWCTR